VGAIVRASDANGVVVEKESVEAFQAGEAYLVAAVADGSTESVASTTAQSQTICAAPVLIDEVCKVGRHRRLAVPRAARTASHATGLNKAS
jgi:hypothetical protein